MGKRFSDTELWERPWFMDLTQPEKLAWLYLTARCDAVGVWVPNFKLAHVFIGSEIDWYGFQERVNGNIRILPNGKWWLVDFCEFQYGELVETNNAHRSYIRQLRRHGIEGLVRGSGAPQEKEKEQEKEKGKEKEKEGGQKSKSGRVSHPTLDVPMTQGWYDRIATRWGTKVADRYIEKVMAWDSAGEHGTKDFAARAATFIERDVEAGKLSQPPKDDGPRTFAEAREMG